LQLSLVVLFQVLTINSKGMRCALKTLNLFNFSISYYYAV